MQTSTNPIHNRVAAAGDVNRGNNGKFTSEQTEDRARVHAKAMATGSPPVRDIVVLWKEKYGIDIALQSEKEWRRNNRDLIERKKQELIESGEIQVPVVSEKTLAFQMMQLTIQTGSVVRNVKDKLSPAVRNLNTTMDFVEQAGYTATSYAALEGEERKKADARIKDLRADHRLRVDTIDVLSSCLATHSKSYTDIMEQMAKMASRIKIRDNDIEKKVNDQFEKLLKKQADMDSEDFDPLVDVITDADRAILEGTPPEGVLEPED